MLPFPSRFCTVSSSSLTWQGEASIYFDFLISFSVACKTGHSSTSSSISFCSSFVILPIKRSDPFPLSEIWLPLRLANRAEMTTACCPHLDCKPFHVTAHCLGSFRSCCISKSRLACWVLRNTWPATVIIPANSHQKLMRSWLKPAWDQLSPENRPSEPGLNDCPTELWSKK